MTPSEQVSAQVAKVVGELQTKFDVWLHNQLFNNEFLIAGIGTLALGAAAYLLRSVPKRLWRTFLRLVTVELTINNDTEAFLHVLRRLDKSRIRWMQRTFLLEDGTDDGDRYDNDGMPIAAAQRLGWTLGPGLGRSIFTFERRPVIGNLVKENSDSREFKMSLNLRFLGRSSKRVRRFVQAVHASSLSAKEGIDVYSASGGHWSAVARDKAKRPLATVFLPAATKAELMRRLTWFYANEDWYRQRGLPYKMGVLLTGVPGGGKSSLIHALASELNKTIRLLSLNVINDSSLGIMKSIGARDLLVIEDIDTFSVAGQRAAVKEKRKRRQREFTRAFPEGTRIMDTDGSEYKAGADPSEATSDDKTLPWTLSLSTLLNMLDGLLSPDGIVTIATTNHPGALDPALIRKGRFDLHIEIGALDAACIEEMFVAFYGEDKRSLVQAFVASGRYEPVVGAVAQDIFRNAEPEDALRQLAKRSNGRASLNGGETHDETDDHRPRAVALSGAGEGG